MNSPAVPMWTEHLSPVSPELDRAITEELAEKPSIMKDEKHGESNVKESR